MGSIQSILKGVCGENGNKCFNVKHRVHPDENIPFETGDGSTCFNQGINTNILKYSDKNCIAIYCVSKVFPTHSQLLGYFFNGQNVKLK